MWASGDKDEAWALEKKMHRTIIPSFARSLDGEFGVKRKQDLTGEELTCRMHLKGLPMRCLGEVLCRPSASSHYSARKDEPFPTGLGLSYWSDHLQWLPSTGSLPALTPIPSTPRETTFPAGMHSLAYLTETSP